MKGAIGEVKSIHFGKQCYSANHFANSGTAGHCVMNDDLADRVAAGHAARRRLLQALGTATRITQAGSWCTRPRTTSI